MGVQGIHSSGHVNQQYQGAIVTGAITSDNAIQRHHHQEKQHLQQKQSHVPKSFGAKVSEGMETKMPTIIQEPEPILIKLDDNSEFANVVQKSKNE
jgi:hypothetical protein